MSEAIDEAKSILEQIESCKIPPPNKMQTLIIIRQLIKAAERVEELEAQLADTEKERDEWKDSAINGGNAAYLREQLAELKKQEPVAWNKPMTIEDSFRSAPVVPPDMVMVPRELTKEMRDAWDASPCCDDDDEEMRKAYRAMIAAAEKEHK